MNNQIDPKNDLVFIGICGERFDLPDFEESKDKILALCAQHIVEAHTARGHRVDRNRDKIVKAFLRSPRKPDWLLFLDSDMTFPEDIVYRLLVHRKPIVGGLYFHRGQQAPLVFNSSGKTKDEWGRMSERHVYLRDEVWDFLNNANIPDKDMAVAISGVPDPLQECDAIGTGGMMIHRSVIEAMPGPWFEYAKHAESEDLSFCRRAKALGFSVHADLSTICGHLTFSAKGYSQFRAIFKSRGIEATNYDQQEAAEMLANYRGCSVEAAGKEIFEYHPADLAEHWEDMTLDDDSVRDIDFYQAKKTGELYIPELIRWNASPTFGQFREALVGQEELSVMEIGSGIGSIAIQLATQRCSVEAYEANSTLRAFSKKRLTWIKGKDKIHSRIGPIRWNGSFRPGSIIKGGDPNSYDLVIALDVLEHMDEKTLRGVMGYIAMLLKPGGRLFCHNAWGDHTTDSVHPFHYDHSEIWPSIVKEHGLFQLSPMWLAKEYLLELPKGDKNVDR